MFTGSSCERRLRHKARRASPLRRTPPPPGAGELRLAATQLPSERVALDVIAQADYRWGCGISLHRNGPPIGELVFRRRFQQVCGELRAKAA
jgi:hypothetical protein